ncbi:hypothetical protein C8N32_109113 [Rhodovulum imhoffii]|uniref:Uncharacterized protein n=1 Tax=Rhodovulum imhoffii TaxID=365340 RepID=A0A2T5BRS7_9RHOB|nr:glyoxalase [Rhodovulum imhoffii]MBK5933254.1 glyoxalase [Rhodovulum imhoffii]PTN01989.1 hypothetical protein C8N32_109113 [Rhodovulum imhoffii]
MTPQRASFITFGVTDLPRTFCAIPGWRPAQEREGNSFYRLNGQVRALFGRAVLAADQGRPEAMPGTVGGALAQNFVTGAEAGAACKAALGAGAMVRKCPQKVFRGGCSGCYAGPDRHVWEVAMNPFWTLGDDVAQTLPAPT